MRIAPWVLACGLACSGHNSSGGETHGQVGQVAGEAGPAALLEAGPPPSTTGVACRTRAYCLADGIVGLACTVNADCGNGRCSMSEPITGTPFPGGYCTGSCFADSDCGARGYCVPGFLGTVPGSCSLRCVSDADCGRDGYRCRATTNASYCVPGPKPLPDHVVGNACSGDADCGGGPITCAAAVGRVPAPLGYCTESCSIDADCGAGGICINGIMTVLSTGTCYKSCVLPGGCRDGYTCTSPTGSSSDPNGVCAPDRPTSDDGGPESGGPDVAQSGGFDGGD